MKAKNKNNYQNEGSQYNPQTPQNPPFGGGWGVWWMFRELSIKQQQNWCLI